MKLQILQILSIFFLCDRPRLLPGFQIGESIEQLFLSANEFLPPFLSSHRLFMKLQRVADAPEQKCADCEDDKPGMRTHRVGDIHCSCPLILQEEQQYGHQRFSLAPHSAQNLFVFGFLMPQEGHATVDRSLRAEISRRIKASRSLEDSSFSICAKTTAASLFISARIFW